MKAEIPAASPRNGLAVVWDVVVAPFSAFAALRERPAWLWAFVITCVLGIIGAVLQIPAASNVVAATLAHSPSFASLTPAQQQQQLGLAQTIQHYSWTVYPIAVLVAAAVSALVLLIANAIGKGTGSYRLFFALTMNVAIISYGLGYLYVGIVAALRGGDAFASQADLIGALPGLSWLAGGAGPKVVVFLAGLNVFSIWSAVLLTLGAERVAGIPRVVAAVAAAVLLFGAAAFAAAFTR